MEALVVVAPGVWYPYEGGVTIGQRGPEGGIVLKDIELGDPDDSEDADARLTLERAENESGFCTIAQLYGGWLFLIVPRDAFEALKPELERLSKLLPDEDDRDIEAGIARLNAEIAAIEARYGV